MKIDFSTAPLKPEESRSIRNYFGLSQAMAAAMSGLPAHKIKRFETGNYIPDGQFLTALRAFYEDQGFDFHDENAPSAKARANGDIFPAGVVGGTAASEEKTVGSTSEPAVKPTRLQSANLQFMRIAPKLESEQIDRILDCIETNESAINDSANHQISFGFLSDSPDTDTLAKTVALVRRLAENGLLFAHLMGREPLPTSKVTGNAKAKTVGDLVRRAMADVQLAVVEGNKEAQARRKSRPTPTEVLQALVG